MTAAPEHRWEAEPAPVNIVYRARSSHVHTTLLLLRIEKTGVAVCNRIASISTNLIMTIPCKWRQRAEVHCLLELDGVQRSKWTYAGAAYVSALVSSELGARICIRERS